MEQFITFKHTEDSFEYFFNANHIFLLFSSLILIIFFTMYYERRNKKAQYIFVCFATLILIALEAARIVWRYNYLKYHVGDLSFVSVTGLDFFTLALWISIPILLVGILTMRKRDYIFGLSFVFAVGALASIMTLIYPTGLNAHFPFYHAYNLIWLFERIILCMLGFILAISRWIPARDFLDLWGGILSLVFFGAVAIGLNFAFGWDSNLLYVVSCPAFEEVGVFLPFPVHYLLLGSFLFVFQLIMYLPFRLFENYRNKMIMKGKYHD